MCGLVDASMYVLTSICVFRYFPFTSFWIVFFFSSVFSFLRPKWIYNRKPSSHTVNPKGNFRLYFKFILYFATFIAVSIWNTTDRRRWTQKDLSIKKEKYIFICKVMPYPTESHVRANIGRQEMIKSLFSAPSNWHFTNTQKCSACVSLGHVEKQTKRIRWNVNVEFEWLKVPHVASPKSKKVTRAPLPLSYGMENSWATGDAQRMSMKKR